MRFSLPVLLRAALTAAVSISLPAAGQPAPVVLAATEEIPTAYHTDQGMTGFLVDLSREAFRRAGREVKIVTVPWARGLAMARSGEVDGMITLYKTPERETYLDFSAESVLLQDQAFFIRIGTMESFGPDVASLAGKRIGLMTKASYGARFDELVRKGFFPKTDTENNVETMVKMLAGGRVDVVPGYRASVRRTAQDLGLADKIQELPIPMEALPSYVGFTRAHDLSAAKRGFDSGLRAMKADGSYDQLLKRYFPPGQLP